MAKIQIKELCGELQEKFNLSKQETEQFLTAFFAIIKEGVERDGQVKVKGLGTFKIATMDARESINVNTGERILIDEHYKVSFTPDNTMKELVNRPFSLFETVVLNDGVTFDDEEETQSVEEEEVAEQQPIVEDETPEPEEMLQLVDEDVVTESEPVQTEDILQLVEKEVSAEPEPVETEEMLQLVEEEEMAEPQPVETEEPQPAVDKEAVEPEVVETEEKPEPADAGAAPEPAHALEEPEDEESDYDGLPPVERANWWKWLVAAVLLALVCGLGYIYYEDLFGQPKDKLIAESIDIAPTDSVQRDSTKTTVEASADTKSDDQPDSEKLAYTVTHPVKYGPLTKEEKDSIKKEAVKYEEKDRRIRTGGYYIRGLDFEERVRQGDNLKRIARRTIGEELVCYLAAYNNLRETDTLRPGQKIRIPKLIMKKWVLK